LYSFLFLIKEIMRLLSTIFLLIYTLVLVAQPVNDECVDRIQLGEVPLCPVMGVFTTVAATASIVSDDPTINKPACFSGSQPDNDVWFSFIVAADGSAPNLIIEITPENGANGPISQPQVAAYRGQCGEDELAEIACASAAFNQSTVMLELFGLNPGDEIFLRVEDWTASAASNAGDFALCIKAPDPIFNIAEDDGSTLCDGLLFDSGGADGNYGVNESNEFVICPSSNFSCIELNLVSYDTENNFDELNIYEGDDISDPLFLGFEGTGGPISFNISSTCVTVQFTSDGSVTAAGFELSWSCTTGACENSFSTCQEPTTVDNLPYQQSELSTCAALDAVGTGPCNAPGLLNGEEVVFAYTSTGDECIMVEVSNSNTLTGLSIYNDCPEDATECLGSDISAVGSNAVVMMTYLDEPGTYFIIVDNPVACTDFDIAINSVVCANNVPVTCDNPVMINNIPFTDDASTCAATDSEGANDCSVNSGEGEDYVYAYESNGDECISIRLENAISGSTISALNGCSSDSPECFGFAQVNSGDTAVIAFMRTTDPGTYYFVVESPQGCSSFDLQVIPIDCPIVLPPAVDCENALNINGCGNQPQIINVDQVASEDETVVQDGINEGCWGGPGQARYTWFTFQAQADGAFGFLSNNAEDPTISDIDIQVWGPYFDEALACEFMRTTQPIRSTYASPGTPNFTGLTDIHPGTGVPITDICEGAGGDGYVSTLQVQQGEWYLVLINDFSGTIEMGGINMDFSETTPGVLAEFGQIASISPDTLTCPGAPVTIEASGGVTYNWLNSEEGLDCNTCPNPSATIVETTVFTVIVSDACNSDTLSVKVGVLEAAAGADQMSCNGEFLELSGLPIGTGTEGFWTGNTNALSCTECPNPTVNTELLGPGTYAFVYQVGGLACTSTDTIMVMVMDAAAPDFSILADTSACGELNVSLGGDTDPNATYTWTSDPPGFTSADANPTVMVTEPTTYYLEVSNQTCPRVLMDSVTVSVGMVAVLPELTDQILCPGRNYLFDANPEPGFSYTWTPTTGVVNPNSLSTNFSPEETTTYTLTATQNGCITESTFTISVVEANEPMLEVTDDLSVCIGTQVTLDAVGNVAGTYEWSDGTVGGVLVIDEIIQNTMITVTFTPDVDCFNPISETINIMALGAPEIAEIEDQNICSADGFQLSGLTVQPGVMYNWTPSNGVINSNELNANFNPTVTTTYEITAFAGDCSDTESFTINVVEAPVLTVSEMATVCTGMSVMLSASATVPGDFTWNPGNLTGSEVTINDLTESTLFTVSFDADNGCTIADETIMVEVVPGVEITALSVNPQMGIVEGDMVELAVVTEPDSAIIYNWSSGGTGVIETVVPLETPESSYTVTVTGTSGCTDEQTISFAVEAARYGIPNAFRPDGRMEINKVFQVEITGGNIEVLSMKIWNRFGKLVHEGLGTSHGWNGRINGKLALSDVYLYATEIQLPDGSRVTEQGDLTLIR